MRKSPKLAALKAKQKQKEIHKLMFTDSMKFIGNFIVVAAIASLILMLIDIPFKWDNVAITLIAFIIYRNYILPRFATKG